MSSRDRPITAGGAIIMLLLIAAISIVAAIPMMLGVAVTVLVPGIGELRSPDPWLLVHFLWMFPALWVASTVIDAFLVILLSTGVIQRAGEFLEDILVWFAISWFCTAFFRDLSGALLAGLISIVLMKPLLGWLEKHAPQDAENVNYS